MMSTWGKITEKRDLIETTEKRDLIETTVFRDLY